MICVTAAILAFAGAQEEAAKLVERLRSESLEEREEAVRKLKKLGKEARGELEKAAGDKDAEVAGRARDLINVLDAREKMTARLLKAMPGVEEELAAGGHGWTEAFLKAQDRKKYPDLEGEDLIPLVAGALEGARGAREKKAILKAVVGRGLRVIPEVVKFLKDEDAEVRWSAAKVLVKLGAKEAAPEIAKLLKDVDADVRGYVADALGNLGAKEVVPELVKLLKDEDAWVRRSAAWALGELGAKEAAPELILLLKNEKEDGHVRCSGAQALCRLGFREGIPYFLENAEKTSASPFCLNAFSQPELWQRLEKTGFDRDLEGTGRSILESLAKEAGLGLAIEEDAVPKDLSDWLSRPIRLGRREGVSLTTALEETIEGGPCALVLEPGRMRIVPREKAFLFRKEWWKGQPVPRDK